MALTDPHAVQLIDEVVQGNKRLLLGVVRPLGGTEPPEGAVMQARADELYEVGTLGTVVRMLKLGDGSVRVMVQGLERARLVEVTPAEHWLVAGYEPLPNTVLEDARTEALKRTVHAQFSRVIDIAPYLGEELHEVLVGITDGGKLGDFVAANLDLALPAKAELLAIDDVNRRLERLAELLGQELQVLEVGSQIQEKVRTRLDQNQREYVLREQLRVIRQELGEEEGEDELTELAGRLEAAGLHDEAKKVVDRELKRLRQMSPQSAEYHVARTYLEVIASLPWGRTSEDRLDLKAARDILDRDHYDLKPVKERILEYLAVRTLNPAARGGILCFVGPPGVGKTSLGQSIAEALGRRFTRVSLGGVRDDPTAALLEVLDPAQNSTFVDHYLEVPFDLSGVMFIATGNSLAPIPDPLLDRMEVLTLPGYTPGEKLAIAKRYLLPRQLKETGLQAERASVADGALERLIGEFTREAGVRQLEREIQGVLRKAALEVVEGRARSVKISAKNLEKYAGQPKVQSEVAGRSPEVGVATGLAWTPVGGDIMFIEAIQMPGKGQITLTGQLGDVMKESAQAAWSLLRARAGAQPERHRRGAGRGETAARDQAGGNDRRSARAGAARVAALQARRGAAGAAVGAGGGAPVSDFATLEEAFQRIGQQDARYHERGYLFVLAALEYAQGRLPARRHLTGAELAWACRDFALEQFGLLAPTVLGHWGIASTADLGRMVFTLDRKSTRLNSSHP